MATKRMFFVGDVGPIQRPADWNPNSNKFEVVPPAPYTQFLPPQAPGSVNGAPGSPYAWADNVDAQFPISVYSSGNAMWASEMRFVDVANNYICAAAQDTISPWMWGEPNFAIGGWHGQYGGGGAGGPNGAGQNGSTYVGGKANNGTPYSWYDPDTGQTYHLGDGGSAPGYGAENTWGYGSGGGGNPGPVTGWNVGGPGIAVMSWEPLVESSAMVAIMA